MPTTCFYWQKLTVYGCDDCDLNQCGGLEKCNSMGYKGCDQVNVTAPGDWIEKHTAIIPLSQSPWEEQVFSFFNLLAF